MRYSATEGSVRVFVILFQALLVNMSVRMRLAVVAVIVLVLNVVMIMQDVRVSVRHSTVGVLVRVL